MEYFFHGVMQFRLNYEAVDGIQNLPLALNGKANFKTISAIICFPIPGQRQVNGHNLGIKHSFCSVKN
jgi:hypothetical protein